LGLLAIALRVTLYEYGGEALMKKLDPNGIYKKPPRGEP
jgi:hypothetical protein